MLYGAILTFGGLYAYFIVEIFSAKSAPPRLDAVMVSTAAALAGVLGSAFALEVGTTSDQSTTNTALNDELKRASGRQLALARVWQALSLDAEQPAVGQLAQDVRDLGLRDRRVRGCRHLRAEPEPDSSDDQGTCDRVRGIRDRTRDRRLQEQRLSAVESPWWGLRAPPWLRAGAAQPFVSARNRG